MQKQFDDGLISFTNVEFRTYEFFFVNICYDFFWSQDPSTRSVAGKSEFKILLEFK